MGALLKFQVELESTTCPTCGVEHAMPSHMLAEKRRHAGTVYCPSGHSASWKETEADRLRKRLEFEKNRRAQAEAEAERIAASNRALRGANTKMRKRVGNGVCPCCKRTFKQLARHMKAKHPDYAE